MLASGLYVLDKLDEASLSSVKQCVTVSDPKLTSGRRLVGCLEQARKRNDKITAALIEEARRLTSSTDPEVQSTWVKQYRYCLSGCPTVLNSNSVDESREGVQGCTKKQVRRKLNEACEERAKRYPGSRWAVTDEKMGRKDTWRTNTNARRCKREGTATCVITENKCQ